MKRRRKRRASPAPLICLLAVLACIVALRISVSEETAASAQMTGKLESPATTAPARLLEAEMTEAEQVTRAEDRPARAARYVNIEMTDEELADQGIKQNTIRLSIGTEHIDDIIADLEAGFAAVQGQ